MRRAGGGRTPTEKKHRKSSPASKPDDPRDGRGPGQRPEVDTPHDRQARRRTPRLGIHVCPQTVARLLKAMGYSLRVNHKKLAGASHPNRDQQFQHITALRERCAADNSPLISVDTKKKELVGTFRNPGAKWDRSPNSSTTTTSAPTPTAAPCPTASTTPAPTPAPSSSAEPPTPRRSPSTASRSGGAPRAASAIPKPRPLQIPGRRRWQQQLHGARLEVHLQHRFCNRHGLPVRVAHYPPATSKWNPIEHRLFCEISKNWAGRPSTASRPS